MQRLILLLFLLPTTLFAQQDPQFTQFTADRLSINPGSAGMEGYICGTLLLRRQWVGFDGAPRTGMVNLQGNLGAYGGIGLTVMNDQLGQEKNNLFRLAYSYHHTLPNGGKLGFGASFGRISKQVVADWEATDGFILDPSIPDVGVTEGKFDASAGIYYTSPQLHLGLSVTHLPESAFSEFDVNLARHYYLQAGYNYNLPGLPIELQPSILVKSDIASTQIDVNVNALWNNKFWFGLSYRPGDAIAPQVGMLIPGNNNLTRIGYSYDVNTSALRAHNSGTHELMVSFCLEKLLGHTRWRNTRWL